MKYEVGSTFDASETVNEEAYDIIVDFDSSYEEGEGEPRPAYVVDTVDADGEVMNESQFFGTEKYHEWVEEGDLVEVPKEETPL